MNYYMKQMVMVLASVTFLSACEGKLDTTNKETFLSSFAEMTENLTTEEQGIFASSLMIVTDIKVKEGRISKSTVDETRRQGKDLYKIFKEGNGLFILGDLAQEMLNQVGSEINGKTVEEINAMAEQATLASIEYDQKVAQERKQRDLKRMKNRLVDIDKKINQYMEEKANLENELNELVAQKDAQLARLDNLKIENITVNYTHDKVRHRGRGLVIGLNFDAVNFDQERLDYGKVIISLHNKRLDKGFSFEIDEGIESLEPQDRKVINMNLFIPYRKLGSTKIGEASKASDFNTPEAIPDEVIFANSPHIKRKLLTGNRYKSINKKINTLKSKIERHSQRIIDFNDSKERLEGEIELKEAS